MNGHSNYEMAKMRMAENHRWAANERLARDARQAHRDSTVKHEERENVGFSLKKLIPHFGT